MAKSFNIVTFGCKSNQYDSQLWRRLFLDAGWKESSETADVCLVNTCTVTASADRQARQAVRKLRRENPRCALIVAGCGVAVSPEAFSRMPEVDLAAGRYGPESIGKVARLLKLEAVRGPESIRSFAGHTRAFLKVQDGCGHGCAYCIVPRARGGSRSRDLASVVAEARDLLEGGHRELVVTGIRLGDFRPSLSLMLSALAGLPGLDRLRISSLEPDDVTDELVETVSRQTVIARHLHLPLQSGSDRILKAMGRPYLIGQYGELLDRISRSIPGMTFGTDLMVGFPGETEEDFRASLEAARQLPISHLHAFSYSRRPGTKAAVMPGQIPEAVKKERSQRLRESFREKQQGLRQDLVGKRETVLFETREGGRWTGLGEHYFRVLAGSEDGLHNRLRRVRLTSVCGEGLEGELEP